MGFLGWLLGVILWLALFGLVLFSFVPMATLIASPFNDILSEKVERIFTAISEDRPYRARMNKEEVYKILKNQSETEFAK